jgi:hypothetical protein
MDFASLPTYGRPSAALREGAFPTPDVAISSG